MKNRILLLFLSLFFITSGFAQKWKIVENSSFKSLTDQRLTIPNKYDSYELNVDQFKTILNKAPKRFESDEEGVLIYWPMPGNKLQKFKIRRSDVFHPDLAARYSEIKAFTGYSDDDPTAILKISLSHKGIEGMLLSDRHETQYLDRFLPKSKNQYILYKRSDYGRKLKEGEGNCTVEIPEDGYKGIDNSVRFGDCQLRKFRLALACTGEYATFHGGNVPDVLAEYNASLIRINGIYERDLTITMELIANTDELIFLSGGTDPYTNNDGVAMLSQNQTTVDQIIGFDNYDIGHVYSTGGGGIASLRSPCTNRKARGVTGLGDPTGDFFWVDYVAHEIGHQFGGNHTFNNSCGNNRNSNTAIEPGSGATIMAYAGICAPNVQSNSDDYFHSINQSEVANFVVAGNGNCAEVITIDNSAPVVESTIIPDGILPSQTPFYLTARATDADNDPLTYCWEQIDNEIATMPPVATSVNGPTFRSYDPSENPTRYFPRLTSILTGANGNTWEILPDANRNMDFNVTVRDNNPLGGCTDNVGVTINFTSDAGPFLITSQNSTTTWSPDETESITWNVSRTDIAPVSCEYVDIIFSLDRGNTFTIMLAEGVSNDGQHDIQVPFEFTSQGRIMLRCSSSTFFDINNRDINVIAPFSSSVSPTDLAVCPDETATFKIDYMVFGSDPLVSTFNLEGLPDGATYNFSPDQTDVDSEITLTIENLTSDLAGLYPLDITVQSPMLDQHLIANLTVQPDQNDEVIYLSPEEGQIGVSNSPILSWEPQNGISTYEVEVAKNPNFVETVFSSTTSNNFISAQGLNPKTIYYWRVRGVSSCLDPVWANIYSFQTNDLSCLITIEEANIIIDENGGNTIESEIVLTSSGLVQGIEVSMNIDHTYVGDLIGKLRAPNGFELILFDQPGVPETDFGCVQDNIAVTFSANAINTLEDFENSCNVDSSNAIEGIFQPLESFSLLNNVPTAGTWTLIIEDVVGPDGGQLIDWSMKSCESVPLESGVILKNNILQLNNATEGLITNTHLEMENNDSVNTWFVMRRPPTYGEVGLWDETSGSFVTLSLGDTFTQEDVNQDRIKYELLDLSVSEDRFIFDTEDDQSRFTSNNTFLISANISPLSISASISSQISCFGETDGRIEVMGLGGIEGYTFSINEGPFEAQNIFENLVAGEYAIIVRDNVGSEVTSEVLTIIEPSQITFVFFIGDNEITIGAEGGTGSFMYSLDGVNYVPESTIAISDGTTYSIYVKDENECISQSFNEMTFYQIGSADINVVDVDCKSNASGSITVNSVSGGESPYTYQLNDEEPSADSTFSNLPADTYSIKITGTSGNAYTQMDIVISEPLLNLGMTSEIIENSITLTGNGGTEPYQYSLDGINFTDNNEFGQLEDGEYMGYIRDANGCDVSESSIVVNTATFNPKLEQVNIFPNPTSANFILGSEATIDLDVQIIDITGKVLTQRSSPTNRAIGVEDLSVGLYMIKVSYKDSFRIFKLSKI